MPHRRLARAGSAPPKYCSAGCRSHRLNDDDRRLESTILDLLQKRGRGKSICPSEASRIVFGDEGLKPPCMERARRAARRLVAAGAIQITQRGHVVDPSTARGPIRLRLHP